MIKTSTDSRDGARPPWRGWGTRAPNACMLEILNREYRTRTEPGVLLPVPTEPCAGPVAPDARRGSPAYGAASVLSNSPRSSEPICELNGPRNKSSAAVSGRTRFSSEQTARVRSSCVRQRSSRMQPYADERRVENALWWARCAAISWATRAPRACAILSICSSRRARRQLLLVI